METGGAVLRGLLGEFVEPLAVLVPQGLDRDALLLGDGTQEPADRMRLQPATTISCASVAPLASMPSIVAFLLPSRAVGAPALALAPLPVLALLGATLATFRAPLAALGGVAGAADMVATVA
jgi:hypothetical protein